jgi:hypothetical protein
VCSPVEISKDILNQLYSAVLPSANNNYLTAEEIVHCYGTSVVGCHHKSLPPYLVL